MELHLAVTLDKAELLETPRAQTTGRCTTRREKTDRVKLHLAATLDRIRMLNPVDSNRKGEAAPRGNTLTNGGARPEGGEPTEYNHTVREYSVKSERTTLRAQTTGAKLHLAATLKYHIQFRTTKALQQSEATPRGHTR